MFYGIKNKDQYKKISYLCDLEKKNQYKVIFYLVACFSLVLMILVALLIRGQSFSGMFIGDNNDTFMDYFNSISDVITRSPYEHSVIYPPLANLIYLFFVHLASIDAMSLVPHLILPKEMRLYQDYMLPFMFYFMLTVIGLWVCCKAMKKGSEREKLVFACLMLFSAPMLYAFERGNIIIVALIFTMVFFLWKDSPNKVLREVALISLAIAAAIKIYPAIFGFLVLREKRYKETLRLFVYGLFFLLAPVVFFGGFDQIPVWIHNIFRTSSQVVENYYSYKLNFSNTFGWLTFGHCPSSISTIFTLTALIVGIVGCFFLEQEWKRVLIATLLLIGVPPISYVYAAIFLVIPLIYFLDNKRGNSKLNYIYLLLMTATLVIIPFSGWRYLGERLHYKEVINLSTAIESTAILAMTVILLVEIIIVIFLRIKKKINQPKEIQTIGNVDDSQTIINDGENEIAEKQ